MPTPPSKPLRKHDQLIHSENMKVLSHVQRPSGDWIMNTLMLEGYDVPFQYKRREKYKDLQGGRGNLTYYPITQDVGIIISPSAKRWSHLVHQSATGKAKHPGCA